MSLRCVAADSIYANNANRKFSMQHIRPVDYQYFINKMVEKSVLHFFSSLNEYKISAFFGIMKASEKLCAKSFLRG